MIIRGPNISTPQYVNESASVHLSYGRSAIFWYPIFSCSLRHITHLCIRCWVIALAFTIHMLLCLRWFKIIPLAPWVTLWWLHWMIILETANFFGRMTGWFSSSSKFDFLNLPTTCKISKPSNILFKACVLFSSIILSK